jgi:DNA-binding CsgD family transcriptional regulator
VCSSDLVAPFAWDEVEAHGSKIAAFWRRAERFGLRHGYTIPLNGPRGQRAAFGLSGTTEPIPIEGRRERFGRSWSFAVSLLEDMLREYEPREVTGEQRLTSQQKQALSMIALGLSIRDIAARLELHPRTVEYHLHGALERLGAATREQAIVRALLSGEIESLQYPDELRDWCVRSDGQ